MLGLFRKITATPRDFERGYSEASQLIEINPYLHAREVLEHLGILPGEIITDNYDIWNPSADRTTRVRFGGDDHRFYEFSDGAQLAVDERITGVAA